MKKVNIIRMLNTIIDECDSYQLQELTREQKKIITILKSARNQIDCLGLPEFNLKEANSAVNGSKVDAVKLYRNRTGCSLRQALHKVNVFLADN